MRKIYIDIQIVNTALQGRRCLSVVVLERNKHLGFIESFDKPSDKMLFGSQSVRNWKNSIDGGVGDNDVDIERSMIIQQQ